MDREEERKRLKTRNYVVGGILAAIVILFYLITLVKLEVGVI
ncbi:DUF2970 domain-containing protein [Sneathiella limimaris]|nr:DUF2970 domain-containing protein [Sneathiella limimaris]